MKLIKNTKVGGIKLKIIIFFYFYLFLTIIQAEIKTNKFVEMKILDKVSSKNNSLIVEIGKNMQFKNLLIKVLKCMNSEFDDSPEITAYLQVKDLNDKNNDEVFIFNGWTFSSSPSMRPFEHPVYDIWLIRCY